MSRPSWQRAREAQAAASRQLVVRRGRRVLELRAEGLQMDEVCERLGISYRQANYAWRQVREASNAP